MGHKRRAYRLGGPLMRLRGGRDRVKGVQERRENKGSKGEGLRETKRGEVRSLKGEL